MTPELRELYQEVILDHSKKPRNFHDMKDASTSANGFNPLCGDKATVFLKLEDGIVKDISFTGQGCSIATASSSMMTESLKGKSLDEAKALFNSFHALVTRPPDKSHEAAAPELGKLAVFSGVSEFPVRVKCASLPWHTFIAATEGQTEPVKTE
jgi:nitrogen fixation NifU-like protein